MSIHLVLGGQRISNDSFGNGESSIVDIAVKIANVNKGCPAALRRVKPPAGPSSLSSIATVTPSATIRIGRGVVIIEA